MQGEIKIARRRGRPRQDIENRVHLCECGNSYFSYAALWSHQKKKHRSDRSTKDEKSEDGAKSQQSKEEPFKRKRSRGRPKQNSVKVVQDSNAQVLENEEASLTKFCDLLMKEDKVNVNLRLGLKEIYMKEQLFEYFKEYRSEEKQPNYNECEDLFEDSLLNI